MKTFLLAQRTRNLGDDMQTLAVRRLLRSAGIEPAGEVNRERVSSTTQQGLLPMAAWWKFDARDWPPAPGIVPLPMGVHLSTPALVEGHEDWWRRWEPIGCRDRATREMLLSRGIEAWFSGCVTLTLGDWTKEDWTPDEERAARLADALMLPTPLLTTATNRTLLVDCWTVRGCAAVAPGAVRASHQIRPERVGSLSLDDRLYLAVRMAMLIWMADTVITTRLHAYLPALAMGRRAVLLGPPDTRTADYGETFDPREMAESFRRDFAKRIESLTK